MRMLSLAAAVAALSLAAGAAQAQMRVSPSSVSGWLTEQGLSPEIVSPDDDPYVRVRDGQITWLLFFYGCGDAGCDSLQFAASFTNDAITMDRINQWNRDRRFLKAYFEAGDEGTAVVQYDVIPTAPAVGGDMNEHLSLWRRNVNLFAVHVGFLTAAE